VNLLLSVPQFKETPESLAQKKGVNLTALTPGSAFTLLLPSFTL
jgi:hypothetical protein